MSSLNRNGEGYVAQVIMPLQKAWWAATIYDIFNGVDKEIMVQAVC